MIRFANIARLGAFAIGAVAAMAEGRAGARDTLQTVSSVDLNRYMGRWYEIAHLPAWFQRACASDVTATYTLRPDGKVTVLNECRKSDGSMKTAKGTARRAGANAKLKVSFFWPFSGDYWILDLDPGYHWVMVGEPSRKYLWILSRETTLDAAVYSRLLQRAESQGYDLKPLIKTRHGR